MARAKRKPKSEKTTYHIYALKLNGVVRDVGQSYQKPGQRQSNHRKDFNGWMKGSIRFQLGFYEFLKRYLMGIKWEFKTEAEHSISWEILDGPREMTGYEADKLEDEWIQKFPTTLNKLPGGTGKGKSRQVDGSRLAITFGCVGYHTRGKRYLASYRDSKANGKQISLGTYKTLTEAYAALTARYEEVKHLPCYEDVNPRPEEHYRQHLFAKYDLNE